MGWFVEIFPVAPPDTRKMQNEGLVPTRVFMDGEYIQAPESPGLFARNRYDSCTALSVLTCKQQNIFFVVCYFPLYVVFYTIMHVEEFREP